MPSNFLRKTDVHFSTLHSAKLSLKCESRMKTLQIDIPDVPLLGKLCGGMTNQSKRANQEKARKARNTGVNPGGKVQKGNSQRAGGGGGRPQADALYSMQTAAGAPVSGSEARRDAASATGIG